MSEGMSAWMSEGDVQSCAEYRHFGNAFHSLQRFQTLQQVLAVQFHQGVGRQCLL